MDSTQDCRNSFKNLYAWFRSLPPFDRRKTPRPKRAQIPFSPCPVSAFLSSDFILFTPLSAVSCSDKDQWLMSQATDEEVSEA